MYLRLGGREDNGGANEYRQRTCSRLQTGASTDRQVWTLLEDDSPRTLSLGIGLIYTLGSRIAR